MNLYDELIKSLHYEPSTGKFTWIHDRIKYKAGDDAGYVTEFGYKKIGLLGKEYFAHRLAWLYMKGRLPALNIDHIDGDRLNNKWSNLREATVSENMQNQTLKRNNASGFIGVYFHNVRKTWRSRIMINGKYHNLGYFKTPEEASAAYVKAKAEIHKFNPVPR